jgi:hypothetical protein
MHNRRAQAEREPLLKTLKEESESTENMTELDESIPTGKIPVHDARQRGSRKAADWVWAREKHGRHFPQTISHRGYKAANPENTMKSFEGAVAAGTHAIETDIHLSKDDVVVLSHVSRPSSTTIPPLIAPGR